MYQHQSKTHGNRHTVIDKPHNTCLQIVVNTGLLSLAAVLGIFLLVFIRGVKLHIFKKKKRANTGAHRCFSGVFHGDGRLDG